MDFGLVKVVKPLKLFSFFSAHLNNFFLFVSVYVIIAFDFNFFVQPDRLVANDFIQCRKVAEHVLDKLLGEGTATPPGGEGDPQAQSATGYTVDQIQLICSDQVNFFWILSADGV